VLVGLARPLRSGALINEGDRMKITITLVLILLITGTVAYEYRPVCHYTSMTLNDKDGQHELYACKRLGWIGKL